MFVVSHRSFQINLLPLFILSVSISKPYFSCLINFSRLSFDTCIRCENKEVKSKLLCETCYKANKQPLTIQNNRVRPIKATNVRQRKRAYRKYILPLIELLYGDERTFFETLQSRRAFSKWDKPRRREIARKVALKIRDKLNRHIQGQCVETLFSTFQSLRQWDLQRNTMWLTKFNNAERRTRLRFLYGVRGIQISPSQTVRKALDDQSASVNSMELLPKESRDWGRQGNIAFRDIGRLILDHLAYLWKNSIFQPTFSFSGPITISIAVSGDGTKCSKVTENLNSYLIGLCLEVIVDNWIFLD